jgi:DNA-binding transcriptional ArsR family regulator
MFMNPTSHLTYAERVQRIGQLLSKGITLLLLDEAEQKRTGTFSREAHSQESELEEPIGPQITDETQREIFEYVRRVGKASPREIQRALEISKATVFRKLAQLTQAKLIIRLGKTTAIRYKLAADGRSPTPARCQKQRTIAAGLAK